MRATKNVLEGIGFVSNAATGAAKGLKSELCAFIQAKITETIRKMDLVTRAEYDELRLMVEKLRAQQEKSKDNSKRNNTQPDQVDSTSEK